MATPILTAVRGAGMVATAACEANDSFGALPTLVDGTRA
jgi:hypothetical protein